MRNYLRFFESFLLFVTLISCVSTGNEKKQQNALDFQYSGYDDSKNIVTILYQLIQTEKKTIENSIWKYSYTDVEKIVNFYNTNTITIYNVFGGDKISYYTYNIDISLVEGQLKFSFSKPVRKKENSSNSSSIINAMYDIPVSYNYEPVAMYLAEKIKEAQNNQILYDQSKSALFSDLDFLVRYVISLTDIQFKKFCEEENFTIKVEFKLTVDSIVENKNENYKEYKYLVRELLDPLLNVHVEFYTNNKEIAMTSRGTKITIKGVLGFERRLTGDYIVVKE